MDRDAQKYMLDTIVREFLTKEDTRASMSLAELKQSEEAVKKSGERILRSWEEFLMGYTVGNIDMALTRVITKSQSRAIIAEKGIDFSSMCMHHFLPFYGTIDIIYMPEEYLCGLSKLSRVVEKFSRRFQLQEILGDCIAEEIQREVQANWVIVRVNSLHTCVGCRGVRKQGASLTTIHVQGNMDALSALEVLKSV